MPSVMPVTAGTIAEPAIEVAICEAATAQKFCQIRMMEEATTTAMPGTMTHARLCDDVSMKPPTGVAISRPAILPIASAVPIIPLAQPRSSRKTPTNGPMPDCMSAMKKLTASNGHNRAGPFSLRCRCLFAIVRCLRSQWRAGAPRSMVLSVNAIGTMMAPMIASVRNTSI